VTDNLKGILAVLAASSAFVVNDAVVKLLAAELPTGEILVVRGVLATAMLSAGVLALGASRPLSILFTPMMLLRLLAAAGATALIVVALRDLPLATVNTVLQVTPLAVTAGAAIAYGERVGLPRWLAALCGFAGVVLIVKPGGGTFGIGAWVLLCALLCTTTRDLTTRGLDRTIPSIFVAAASMAAVAATGLLVVPFDAPWTLPTISGWTFIVVSAACLFVANTFLIVALRTGEIAVVAPFRYVAAPLAIVLGWWWWGDVPDALGFSGIGMVVAAGLYTLHRERTSLAARAVPAPGSQIVKS
jgi:drug/metabolite transporter (DMT)-like permease